MFDTDTANNLTKNNNVGGNGAGIVDNGNNLLIDNTVFDNGTVSSQLRRISKDGYTKRITPKLKKINSYNLSITNIIGYKFNIL